jgi:N-acetylglutamate synthase-like GNAT family acetyltransferase
MSDDISVRTFRPEDDAQVKKIFTDGMQSIMPSLFSTVQLSIQYHAPIVYTSVLLVLLVLFSQIAYYFTRRFLISTTIAVLFVMLSILLYGAVIYAISQKMMKDFINYSKGADLKDINNFYSKGLNRFWVAIDDRTGQVVGCVAIQEKEKDVLELKRMSVRSDIRRRGVGVKLMESLEEYCHGKCKKIALGTSTLQPAAIALYRKRGFVLKKSHFVSTFIPISSLWFEKEFS